MTLLSPLFLSVSNTNYIKQHLGGHLSKVVWGTSDKLVWKTIFVAELNDDRAMSFAREIFWNIREGFGFNNTQ